MNKYRRKELDRIMEVISMAASDLGTVRDDEEEARDNIPENLQGSERYERAEEICDELNEIVDTLEEIVDRLIELEY